MSGGGQRPAAAPKFAAPAEPAWVPDPTAVANSRVNELARRLGHEDAAHLHAAAVIDPETFWSEVVADLGLEFTRPFERVIDETRGHEFPSWFVGGSYNVVQNACLRHATGPYADKDAVVYEGDDGTRRALTYRELDVQVRRFAGNLAAAGVRRGDRVVLFVPVVPEASVAFLAIAMIGAISVPAFTGFSAEALATRIRDSEAVAVVTADATTRRGGLVPLKLTVDRALDSTTTVSTVFVVRHQRNEIPMSAGRDVYWDELDAEPRPAEVADTDSNEPLAIVYTSGTTGAPKGIVHTHAGLGVKAAYDFAYGFDVSADDTIAWISDMGWLVGPLMILGGLQLGATIIFMEGVPTFPTEDRIWETIERNQVTVQGVAPTGMRAVMSAGSRPARPLKSLRAYVSTGEAWDEATWWWLFEAIGRRRVPIINYSGGTEVGGGLIVGYPSIACEAAGFNGPLPGIDVDVVDETGEPVTGTVGELVVRNTFPGMTQSFWRDDQRYLETYWDRWKNVWVHGDLASITPEGSWKIHGRSDDTIKVSGRRIGPSEIETALLADGRIAEAAAIGVPDPARGQSIVAFVVLADADAAPADIAATALVNVGRSFAPVLEFVPSLPKTKNGKVMRRAIRARYLDQPPGDLSSLDPATPLDDIPVAKLEVER